LGFNRGVVGLSQLRLDFGLSLGRDNVLECVNDCFHLSVHLILKLGARIGVPEVAPSNEARSSFSLYCNIVVPARWASHAVRPRCATDSKYGLPAPGCAGHAPPSKGRSIRCPSRRSPTPVFPAPVCVGRDGQMATLNEPTNVTGTGPQGDVSSTQAARAGAKHNRACKRRGQPWRACVGSSMCCRPRMPSGANGAVQGRCWQSP